VTDETDPVYQRAVEQPHYVVPTGNTVTDEIGLFGGDLPGAAHDWRVILSLDRSTVKARIEIQGVPYLRFAYRLLPEQELDLRIRKRHGTEMFEETIPLHFAHLFEGPEAPAYRNLVVAVHVDDVTETIEGAWLESNKSIFVGAVVVGRSEDAGFWAWSQPGGGGIWKEVEPAEMLVHAPRDPHFGPLPPDELRGELRQFYDAYYGVAPIQDLAERISFMPRDYTGDLPAPPDEQPLDVYDLDEYRQFLGDEPSETAERPARWQQLVPLIAMRPAGAYALGLFRVLKEDAVRLAKGGCTFKVQGTWPDGRRYCAYHRYIAGAVLPRPSITAVEATPAVERRALRDFKTSRTHYPLRVVRLSAKPEASSRRPAGLVVYRHRTGAPDSRLIRSHFVPVAGDEEATLVDDHETYPNTDIPRVLDGAYHYYAFGFDLFGQQSKPGDATATVAPRPLRPDGVEKVAIDFPRVPRADAPGEDTQLDLPIEIEPWPRSEGGYRLKVTHSSWLPLDVSFFWPPEAAYRWNENRGQGVPSTKGFRLYYGIDTLPSVPLHGVIDGNGPEGVEIAVHGVSANGSNRSLYRLLRRLGVTTSSGPSVGAVGRILQGGSVSVGTALKIAAVTDITSSSLRLRCVRFEQAERDEVARQGFDLGFEALRVMGDFDGEIGWNQDAQAGPPARPYWMGWKLLARGLLLPLPRAVEERSRLVARVTTPGVDVAQSANGVSAYKADNTEGFSFRVDLPHTHRLASHRMLLITPLPSDGSEPGETDPDRAGGDQVTIPSDVDKVFSDRLVRSFYIERVDRSGDKAIPLDVVAYRGRASIAEMGTAGMRYVLLPDQDHQRWRITPPVERRVHIPLSDLLRDSDFEGNTHKATLRVAVETVADSADNEVENALQEAKAQQKLVFVRDLPAPSVVVTTPPPPVAVTTPAPSFGIAALPPDYYGRSLVTLETIYDGYELATQLPDDLSYDLYRLPAGRLVPGLVTQYAWDGSRYRRNLQALTAMIAPESGPTGLKVPMVSEAFERFAVRITASSLSREALLAGHVELPGDTRSVFLYALRPYDAAAGKHGPFAALSPPV
jgi:hypothetical protein